MEAYFEYGLWGLFFASFLAATVIPFSSEALLAVMIAAGYNMYTCIWVATAGNFLGGMSSYYLGFIGKWEWIEKYMKIKPHNIKKIKSWLDKYGSFAAFFTWVPVIGDPIAVGLGFIRSNVFFVAIFMFIGKMLRYLLLAWLTNFGLEAVTT
jgi:membrane protein YqaA with SNARE-associated domain